MLLFHKEVTRWRGFNAVKLCPLCQNVCKHDSVLLPDDAGFLIPSTSLDLRRYVLHSNESVRRVLHRLDEVKQTNPDRLDRLEYLFGYNWCPNNVFLDPHLDLRLVDICTFDWMHVYFVSGIYTRELQGFTEALDEHGLGASALHGFLQLWVWPRATAGAAILCKARNKSHRPSGTASEFMASTRVVRKWVVDVVMPCNVCRLECCSMLALIATVELLPMAQAGTVDATVLEQHVLEHLRAHLAAYGASMWSAKFHYSIHLARHLLAHGCLPSCFCMERMHRFVKRFVNSRSAGMGGSGFDRGRAGVCDRAEDL